MARPGRTDRLGDRLGNPDLSSALSPLNLAVTQTHLRAAVLEIFQSRQGEGICVGDSQVFLRLGGCNLVCDYCDTPESIPVQSGRERSLEEIGEALERLRGHRTHPVLALTGGEPLLQVSFLQELVIPLRARGWKIYLETNGTMPEALEKIVGACDWIAMDLKVPSAIGRDVWEAQRWFLRVGGDKIFVKMVLTDSTAEAELQQGVALVAAVRPDIPLVLQPATPWGRAGSIPLERLASWWAWTARRLSDVRIIPQVHRLWGIA
jgi:organic radical activating enzyme